MCKKLKMKEKLNVDKVNQMADKDLGSTREQGKVQRPSC